MEMRNIPIDDLLDPEMNISGIDSNSHIPFFGQKSLHAEEMYDEVVNDNAVEKEFVETIFRHYLTECFPECLPYINGKGEFISDGKSLAVGRENKMYSGGIYAFSKVPVEELRNKKIVSLENKVDVERYDAISKITPYLEKTKGNDGIYLITKDHQGCNIVLNSALINVGDVDVRKYTPYPPSEVGVKTRVAIYAATQLGEHNMKTAVIKQTARDALGFGTMLVFNDDGLEMEVYLKHTPIGTQPSENGYSVSPEDMVQNIAVVMNTYKRIDGQLTCNKTVELSISEFYHAWGFDISKHCGAKNLPGMGQYSAQFTQVIPPSGGNFETPILPIETVYTIRHILAAK